MDDFELLTQTGNESISDLAEWFGNLTYDDILAECNRVWPTDDNSDLAQILLDRFWGI